MYSIASKLDRKRSWLSGKKLLRLSISIGPGSSCLPSIKSILESLITSLDSFQFLNEFNLSELAKPNKDLVLTNLRGRPFVTIDELADKSPEQEELIWIEGSLKQHVTNNDEEDGQEKISEFEREHKFNISVVTKFERFESNSIKYSVFLDCEDHTINLFKDITFLGIISSESISISKFRFGFEFFRTGIWTMLGVFPAVNAGFLIDGQPNQMNLTAFEDNVRTQTQLPFQQSQCLTKLLKLFHINPTSLYETPSCK